MGLNDVIRSLILKVLLTNDPLCAATLLPCIRRHQLIRLVEGWASRLSNCDFIRCGGVLASIAVLLDILTSISTLGPIMAQIAFIVGYLAVGGVGDCLITFLWCQKGEKCQVIFTLRG